MSDETKEEKLEEQQLPTKSEQDLKLVPVKNVFGSIQSFEDGQRMAVALSNSTLVPKEFQKNAANCMIALELANRMGVPVFSVLQGLVIIYGRPSWYSQFSISMVNCSGRFSEPLQFKVTGTVEKKNLACYAWTKNHSGEIVKGPPVTWLMAEKEGWVNKAGSKWQTMPELMIQYRAGTFFARLYAPDLLSGMKTAEEMLDMGPEEKVHTEPPNLATPEEQSKEKPQAEDAKFEDLPDGNGEQESPESSKEELVSDADLNGLNF